jgi:hypothetical protein
MKQYQLTQDMLGYSSGQIFQGPYPTKSQQNKIYCPINALPGPEGTDMGLFSSFVEASLLYTEVKGPETKNPGTNTGDKVVSN